MSRPRYFAARAAAIRAIRDWGYGRVFDAGLVRLGMCADGDDAWAFWLTVDDECPVDVFPDLDCTEREVCGTNYVHADLHVEGPYAAHWPEGSYAVGGAA